MNSFCSLDEYYNNNSNKYILRFLEFVNSVFKSCINTVFVMFIPYSFKVYIQSLFY